MLQCSRNRQAIIQNTLVVTLYQISRTPFAQYYAKTFKTSYQPPNNDPKHASNTLANIKNVLA